MKQATMDCAAKEYGDCTIWGKKEVDVLFLYRDKYGGVKPDEIIKVCMCEAHRGVLEKYHEGRALEMRGEEVRWALHDDLFIPFSKKEKMYTYMKIRMKCLPDSEIPKWKFCLVNGRDIEKFRELMLASDPEIDCFSEEGVFLTHFNIGKDEEEVIEMKYITRAHDIDVLEQLTTYYNPMPNMIINRGPGWISVDSRVEENPTMETEYTIEFVLPCIHSYFTQKRVELD